MAYEYDLYDMIESHTKRLQDSIFTSLPASVTSYNASQQSVDVEIDVRLPSSTAREEQLTAALTDVPIIFPSGGGGILSFPIKAKDKVLLCFTKYSLDKWKEKGAGVCGESRQHDFNDAVAIAGLFTVDSGSNLKPNPDDVELKAFGSTVTLLASGDIQLTPAGKTIIDSDLDVTGDINCSKTVTGSTDCIGGGKSLKGHTHGGVSAGGSQTAPPT